MSSNKKKTLADALVCVRCATLGPTCCSMDPDETGACFPLSRAEWERLAPHAAQAGSGVEEARAWEDNSPEFLRIMKRLFPGQSARLEELFPPGKKHARLALKGDGCCFLGPEGCRLPRSARPRYCRIFPFWVQHGRMDCFLPEGCLAVKEGRGLKALLQSLGADEQEIKELYLELRKDWGLD